MGDRDIQFINVCRQGDLAWARELAAQARRSYQTVLDAAVAACGRGHLEVVLWLDEAYGLAINDRERGAIFRNACREAPPNGSMDGLEWFATRFAITTGDVRYEDCDALKWACLGGRLGVAQWLTDRFGLTIEDARSQRGILAIASAGGHTDVVKWAVGRFGLTADDARSSGCEPLHLACVFGHLEIASWLYERFELTSADLQSVTGSDFMGPYTQDGMLRSACVGGRHEIVQWLLPILGPPTEEVERILETDMTPQVVAALTSYLEAILTKPAQPEQPA